MPEYLAPGVYVEEVEMGAKPVEGVSTSTTAFIGAAQKGPVMEPTLVTSWSQYELTFGGFSRNPMFHLAYAVDAFFRNGGKRAYIVRVGSDGGAYATGEILNPVSEPLVKLTAKNIGTEGNNISFNVTQSSISGTVNVFKKQINVVSESGGLITLENFPTGFEVGDIVRFTDISNNTDSAVISSINGKVITINETFAGFTFANAIMRTEDIVQGTTSIKVENASNFFPGSLVDISNGTYHTDGFVKGIIGKKLIFDAPLFPSILLSMDSLAPVVNVRSKEFDMTITNGLINESFTNLGMDQRHPRFLNRTISSGLVSINATETLSGITTAESFFASFPISGNLSGGIDINLNSLQYAQGLVPLEKVEGISLVAIPGQTSLAIQQAVIDHCEKMRYRFAVLDSLPGVEPAGTGSVLEQRRLLGTARGFGAIYYPWVQSMDPVTRDILTLPPSGAITGVYARSDSERGVHKAPANEKVAGAIGLERKVTKGEQEVLNPESINVLRFFPGKGNLVWGARTLASDPAWKYVNVRRLFLYLEESIERATQWAVFEPNDPKLWARVKQTITQFLTRVWKDGALMGNTPEDAFFVRCDRSTMTQDDIDNGRLIVLVGAAPVKPAEFVVFRIAQWQGGAVTTE